MAKTSNLAQQLRCLVDTRYRRAFRSLRHFPRVDYRFVIDAGASRGSFTDAFLQMHRPEKLVLVEALPDLAERLKSHYAGRPEIAVVAAALSDKNGDAEFEVNEFDYSSSLLKIDPRNSEWFGRSLKVARHIRVPTLSLPELMQQQGLSQVDLLKLDLQGAERLVLTGGAAVLPRIRVIFSEVLFEPMYAGCWLFWDLHEFLAGRGFKLCGLGSVVHSGQGELLQANATFRRLDAPT
jgi:FkbM family methyltransferase